MDTFSAADSLLILISAPSGGGKTTLCDQVLATMPNTVRAVTCTTRAPRSGEQHGIDYYFLPTDEFADKAEAGEFLEHAVVHGNRYGVLQAEVLQKLLQGKDVLLSIDVQGASTIRRKTQSDPTLRRALVTVFITPPSMKVLEERLTRRGQNSADDLEQRLGAARQEISHWREYDYLIVSTSIDQDLRLMQSIMAAEKMRTGRVRLAID
jgi:guanylate kinase